MQAPYERVRPRISELKASDGDDSWIDWPPAAKVVRARPPSISHAQTTSSTTHAAKETLGASQSDYECSDDPKETPTNLSTPIRPIMGEILEREPASSSQPRDIEPMGNNGKPMSAFRRSRLERTKKDSSRKPPSPPRDELVPMQDASRDPGGGAPPEAMTSLMQDISLENESKVASMSYETRADELKDAESFFGKDVLEKLAQRSARRDPTHEQPLDKHETHPSAGWPSIERRATELDEEIQTNPPKSAQISDRDHWESFRQKYFPDEPDAVPAALEWTVSPNPTTTSSVRFDFHGHVTTDSRHTWAEAPDSTYLAGLHHHGSEQSVPGYTLEELLHLAQSSVASQRALALQVLQRISERYPSSQTGAPLSNSAQLALNADAHAIRARILLTSFWLLQDRHRSVRLAAVPCLDAACRAVSNVPDDPFILADMLTCANPDVNWLWPASQQDAWTPHSHAPPLHSPDASHLELLQHDWADALLRMHVLDALDTWLVENAAHTDAIVSILCMLVLHHQACAKALAQHPHLVQAVVQLGCTQRAWPVADESFPSMEAVLILLRMVQSNRDVASSLVDEGVIDPLLRYVLIPPRDVSSSQSSADAASPSAATNIIRQEHAFLFVTLRILAALGHYGLASTSIRELAVALSRLADWTQSLPNKVSADDIQWYSAQALYNVLNVWTHRAIQGPRHGDLGVNGPMVQAWAPLSEGFLTNAVGQSRPTSSVNGAIGTAMCHLAAWADCAKHCGIPWDRSSYEALLTTCEQFLRHAHASITSAADAFRSRNKQEIRASLQIVAQSVWMYAGVTRFAQMMGWSSLLELVTQYVHEVLGLPWNMTSTPAIRADGIASAQYTHVLTMCANITTPDVQIRLVGLLWSHESAHVARLLESVVRGFDQATWHILAPFFLDNIRTERIPSMIEASMLRDEHTSTLWKPDVAALPPMTDPRTGATLWTSPAAGLPLRADWPLLALDDLLHSGEARALNASNALPTSWDFNEADIVRASLRLAVYVAKFALTPSAFWWLGIYKVFLLEQVSSTAPEASGAATGRDLYTDASVADPMRSLMDMADQLSIQSAKHMRQEPTLEDATASIHGPGLPFYQMYTDLMGLYDAVSMHHPLFAKAIIPPLAMTYAPDYRRLLWNDYAAVLPGITMNTLDAPVVGGKRLDAYLWPCETDEIVLTRYADALARGTVSPNQPFLYAVALHHVCGALWHTIEDEWAFERPISATLQRSIARRVLPNAQVSNVIMEYAPRKGVAPTARRWSLQAQWQ